MPGLAGRPTARSLPARAHSWLRGGSLKRSGLGCGDGHSELTTEGLHALRSRPCRAMTGRDGEAVSAATAQRAGQSWRTACSRVRLPQAESVPVVSRQLRPGACARPPRPAHGSGASSSVRPGRVGPGQVGPGRNCFKFRRPAQPSSANWDVLRMDFLTSLRILETVT